MIEAEKEDKEDKEENSIIHKIDLLKQYPKIIEICFNEYRSKGKGAMICIIGILEGSEEPRLNCYYLPEEQIDTNIAEKIKNNSECNDDSLIFYISDTKYSRISTIKINNLSQYLNKDI